MLLGWNDTIIALATPPGIGAIGVIRLSGKLAIDVVNQVFPSKDLTIQPSHTLHVGWLHYQNELIDEVVISLFKAPRSYTGEDVIEISGHGAPYLLQKILSVFIELGVRLAKPGEFTQRAFLNGKMDLAQAEAVADVIASQTEAAHKAAIHQMRGGFSRILAQLRDELIQFGALIELELDFATEDVEFADREKLFSLLLFLKKHVNELLQSFKLGNVIKKGVSVTIIGKPNVGKSTLLNTLLNENRAIVSDIPGTTRDTIEEVLNIDGILFRLIDTAGIRDTKGDEIEDIGMERSKQHAALADIIIHLKDITSEENDTIQWLINYEAKVVEVFNKYDKVVEDDVIIKGIDVQNPAGIYISAKHNQGINKLKEVLFAKAVDGAIQTESTIVTNARHFQSLQQVEATLIEIMMGLQQQLPGDLLALDIRRCLHFLGEITGEITNEDQLDYIFSKFCIGK